MSLTLTGTGGIFTILGDAMAAMDSLNTSRGTTIPALTKAMLDAYKLKTDTTPAMDQGMQSVTAGQESWKASGAAYTQGLISAIQSLLIEMIREDDGLISVDIEAAITYLVADMLAQSATVQTTTAASTGYAAAAANGLTDLTLLYTLTGGDGLLLENALAETIDITVTTGGVNPALYYEGEEAAVDPAGSDWPMGSAAAAGLTASAPAASLIPNGSFELVDSDDRPTSWVPLVGDAGGSIDLTPTPVQQVVIAGTPTAGYYTLTLTDPYDGTLRTTTPLAWNASGAAVQAAIRAASSAYAEATVATTGTSPNYTHTVTMTGTGRAPAVIISASHLDIGMITPSIVTPGVVSAYRGRVLVLTSDGAELTEMEVTLPTLATDQVYFLTGRMARNSTAASGTLTLAIEDVDGTTVLDSQGGSASLAISVASITTDSTFYSPTMSFRVDPATIGPLTLNMKINPAPPIGGIIYIDELVLVAGIELYPGGPIVAAVGGALAATTDDRWTLPITNDRAGNYQEWFERAFDMRSLGLLLPSAALPTIANYT